MFIHLWFILFWKKKWCVLSCCTGLWAILVVALSPSASILLNAYLSLYVLSSCNCLCACWYLISERKTCGLLGIKTHLYPPPFFHFLTKPITIYVVKISEHCNSNFTLACNLVDSDWFFTSLMYKIFSSKYSIFFFDR